MKQNSGVHLYCQATYEVCIRFIFTQEIFIKKFGNQFSVTPDQLICELKDGSVVTGREQELTIRPRTSLIAKMQAHEVSLGVKMAVRATPKVGIYKTFHTLVTIDFRVV